MLLCVSPFLPSEYYVLSWRGKLHSPLILISFSCRKWLEGWIFISKFLDFSFLSPTLSLPPIEAEPEVNIQFVCSLILALSIGQSVMKIDWRWSLFRHCFFFLNDCIVSHLTQFSSTIDRWGDFKPLGFKLLTHPWNPVLFTIMNSLTQSDPVSLLYQKNILSS